LASCRAALTTDADASCTLGAVVDTGLASCRAALTTDASPGCASGTFIVSDTGTCRAALSTDVDASCTLGTVVDTGLASCRAALTTDANANCIVGNLVDTTTNCRSVISTDVDASCTAGQVVDVGLASCSTGSSCADYLTNDPVSGCENLCVRTKVTSCPNQNPLPSPVYVDIGCWQIDHGAIDEIVHLYNDWSSGLNFETYDLACGGTGNIVRIEYSIVMEYEV
ncbi:MAG: hypothetical protein HRU36_01545, partial [Rickettsiales bacterium]|nr:hypothetical protein [Rickettsiales bacterium]